MPVHRSFFQRIPFFRISILFMIGILINHAMPFDLHWIGIILTIQLSIVISLWYKSTYSAIQIQSYLIALTILISGIFYPFKGNEVTLQTFEQRDWFLAEITQKPAEKTNTFQSVIRMHGRTMSKPAKAIVYFSKTNFDSTLTTGDKIIMVARPQEIKNTGNPFEFDYRTMMQRQGIRYSVYLQPDSYRKTGYRSHSLHYLAEQTRDRLIAILSAAQLEKEERSVISALTLGYRTEIDPETRDYFAATGTMHILAVSGLHVGMVYLIISLLFSVFKKMKSGKIVYFIASIGFLWFYAFITGFSPSVQRATVMFTFVVMGDALRRPVNIYNSLSASAFILMLLNPNVLFDYGFQLSYLAVFGIVFIQPPLQKMLELQNKILLWLWTMFTVSVAAQLATFPLCLLYFHQFPNLFWLSNFFMIPLSTFITWLVFVFFVLSPIPFISNTLALLIQFLTHLMLAALKWMSEIPHALTKGVVINPFQAVLLYAIIAAIIVYLFSKKKSWLFAVMIFFAIFQLCNLSRKAELFNQSTVFKYNTKNKMIHIIHGRQNYVVTFAKSQLSERELDMLENVGHHLKLEKPVFIEQKSIPHAPSDSQKNNY